MRIKLVDQILWCLKAWINILLGIATSLIKGKLKSQFIKSPHLNSFYLYSVWCNLKSQTHTNKHWASDFCFFLFLFLLLWLPRSHLLCLKCRRLNFFREALNEDGSRCVGTHLSHPCDEITWETCVVCWLSQFSQLNDAQVAFSSSRLDKAHFIALFPLLSFLPPNSQCFLRSKKLPEDWVLCQSQLLMHSMGMLFILIYCKRSSIAGCQTLNASSSRQALWQPEYLPICPNALPPHHGGGGQ